MKNKHAKFGGPSYNSFRDICVTDRMTNHRQNDKSQTEWQITDRMTNHRQNDKSQKDNADYIRSLEDRGNQLAISEKYVKQRQQWLHRSHEFCGYQYDI